MTGLVNAARADAGCPPLTDDPELTAYAVQWAQHMADVQDIPHSGGPYAENVAAGYETAGDVVAGWLGSAPHRANIETCDFTRHGVGSAVDEDGRRYWTEVFA